MHKDLIKLGEAATYINGYAFKPDDRGKVGLPIIRIQDLTGNSYDLGFYDGDYPEKIEINDGDVLISWSASLGVYIWNNGKALLNQHIFKVVFDKVNIDKNYFVYAVRYKLDEMGRKTHGATMKHIVKRDIDATESPYPSKHEQIEIANNLKRIENIIELRSNELQLLDELIKARFVEMFGDLNINDKGWREISLFDACNKLKRYPTFCNMEYLAQGVRVIRISNILMDGHMDVDDENYVFVYDGANIDFPDTVIELQDIVMAVRGDGSAAKRIGIIQEEKLVGANISPNLIRIQAKREIIEPVWLFYYLTSEVGQKRLDAYVNKTAKKNIAAKDIAKIVTPVPDLNKQKQYVDFANQVDKSKLLSLIKLLEQLITYLYNVFIIYRQDKGEEVERHE